MIFAFIAALEAANIEPSPVASPVPVASPAASLPAGPTKRSLTLAIPPGWARTESGQFNEWRSPDGLSHFRITALPAMPEYHGPSAADAVKATFQKMVGRFNPKAQIAVKTINVCNGTQAAYRIDDPLGLGSAGFMMILPGTDSSALINFEVLSGKGDPAILATIDNICWP